MLKFIALSVEALASLLAYLNRGFYQPRERIMPLKDPVKRRAYEAEWRANNQEWKRKWNSEHAEEMRQYHINYYKENRAKIAARHDVYYQKNRAIILDRGKQYVADNREKRREYQRRYISINRSSVQEKARAYREKNKEMLSAAAKVWHANNPEKVRAKKVRRMARLAGTEAHDSVLIATWEVKWRKKKSVTCFWCLSRFPPSECQTDHIVPVSRGGPHMIDNLCVSCWLCNKRKSAKLPQQWISEISQPTFLI